MYQTSNKVLGKILVIDLKYSYGSDNYLKLFIKHFCQNGNFDIYAVTAKESPLNDHEVFKITNSKKFINIIWDFTNPFLILRVVQYVNFVRPSIIYFMSSHPLNCILAFLIKTVFKKIFVVSHINDPNPYNHPLISNLIIFYQKIQVYFSHHIVVFGHNIKNYMIANYHLDPNKVQVIRIGPDICTEILEDGEKKYFSLLGRLESYKGIEIFLDAIEIANKKVNGGKLNFLLAGSGDLARHSEKMASIKNLEVINRFLSVAEINLFINQSKSIVMPYVGGMLQSAFIANAYANKCPVIVSDIGSLAENVVHEKTGLIVKSGDAKDLADAILRMIDIQFRCKLAENAYKHYSDYYNWDKSFYDLNALFRSLVCEQKINE